MRNLGLENHSIGRARVLMGVSIVAIMLGLLRIAGIYYLYTSLIEVSNIL